MTDSSAPRSDLRAVARSRCPRCGEGALFAGFLKLAEECDRCGLSYDFADPADGPAFFVMSGVGLVVTGVWAWLTVVFQPPMWLQAVTVFPIMIGACLVTLRPTKSWMVAEQYRHKAVEAVFDSSKEPRP